MAPGVPWGRKQLCAGHSVLCLLLHPIPPARLLSQWTKYELINFRSFSEVLGSPAWYVHFLELVIYLLAKLFAGLDKGLPQYHLNTND